ncbi:pentapeptide repeat-containing protein [Kineococcus sp. GCM10028916]|uniref:pentapeptide repeat-containing protein n=1 Tax=Kineococcus sp. GCM10028916 TaxID=3273394 RepID=UPI003633B856
MGRTILLALTFTLFVLATAWSLYSLPHWLLARGGAEWSALTPALKYQYEASLRTALLQGIGGLLIAVGAFVGIGQLKAARQQAENARRSQLVDAFTRAISQLGEASPVAKVSGIYSLARIAEVQVDERSRIVDVLCRFIRHQGIVPDAADSIEAAIRALPAIAREQDVIDLHGAYLVDRNFSGVRLAAVNFYGADLRRANLSSVTLQGVDLRAADLSGTILRGADLTGALVSVHLTDVAIIDNKTRLP